MNCSRARVATQDCSRTDVQGSSPLGTSLAPPTVFRDLGGEQRDVYGPRDAVKEGTVTTVQGRQDTRPQREG